MGCGPRVEAIVGSGAADRTLNERCSASLTGEDFQTCPDGVSSLPCP